MCLTDNINKSSQTCIIANLVIIKLHISSQQLQQPATEGTLKAYPAFDPEADAAALRKAMKGLGECCSYMYSVLPKDA